MARPGGCLRHGVGVRWTLASGLPRQALPAPVWRSPLQGRGRQCPHLRHCRSQSLWRWGRGWLQAGRARDKYRISRGALWWHGGAGWQSRGVHGWVNEGASWQLAAQLARRRLAAWGMRAATCLRCARCRIAALRRGCRQTRPPAGGGLSGGRSGVGVKGVPHPKCL